MLAVECPSATATLFPTRWESTSMVDRVDPSRIPNWDDEIAGLPGASFFHSSRWTQVMQETYGFKPCHLVVREEDKLQGLLPLMEVNSPLTGRRGVSLPFTDACGPIGAIPTAFSSLVETALSYGRERNWLSLELRGGALFPKAEPSVSYYNHTLHLAERESDLFSRFDSSVRRAIKKSESAGLKVELASGTAALREFYHLVGLTRQRHGLPPQPLRFFIALQKHLMAAGLGRLVLVRRDSRPIAGGLFFQFGATAVYKFGASDDRFQEYRPNNLVMWHALQHYSALGCRTFDFGRTSLRNEGLRRFKLGWGSTETPLHYTKYDFRKRQFVRNRDEATGWHNSVFRLLPRPVSRLIGALLYPHIA